MIRFEKRGSVNSTTAIIVGILAILFGLGISMLILAAMGYKPLEIFGAAFGKTFFNANGLMETLVTWIPISTCGLAVAVAAKVNMWNLGVEGQFYIGAFAATAIALFVDAPMILKLPLMMIAGGIGGGLIALLIALLKIKFKVHDILSSIMLNSIIFQFIIYICSDLWNDPSTGAIQTSMLTESAKLPILVSGTRVHFGILIVIGLMFVSWYIIKYRPSGFQIRAIGKNPNAAKYAGINVKKYLFLMMFFSGCIAGLSGMMEVSGVAHRLQTGIHNGYGFSGFVVAWIARLNTLGIIFVGFLLSGLMVAGFKMQMMGLPSSIVSILQGMILVLCIAGEILSYYKIIFCKKTSLSPKESESE